MGYENLFAAVLLSFVIERVLAVIFDFKGTGEFVKLNGERTAEYAPKLFGGSLKGVLAAGAAILIAFQGDIDIVNEILKNAKCTEGLGSVLCTSFVPIDAWIGHTITGIFIAGGSQASVKLFQDVLGISKANRDLIKSAQTEEAAARAEKAKRDQMHAKLEIQRAENALAVAEGQEKIEALKVSTDLQIAEIERVKNLEDARSAAGSTIDPRFLSRPYDGYLRGAIDNWDEFIQLRAELLAR